MQISSKILKASWFGGSKLITYLLTVPKFLIYDITRHRAFSYSVASTRAIPFNKMKEKMLFVPTYFGANKPGMQADQEVENKTEAEGLWISICDVVKKSAESLVETTNIHKQTVGRIIEPFCYVDCVMSGTDWKGFFALRAEYNAEPHLGYLATLMLEQYLNVKCDELSSGSWHIPFILPEEEGLFIKDKLTMSAARCARTSYDNHKGVKSLEDDKILVERLIQGNHWSPFEHQAQAVYLPSRNSNFSSRWMQQRKLLEKEESVDLHQRLQDMKELCEKRGFTFSS